MKNKNRRIVSMYIGISLCALVFGGFYVIHSVSAETKTITIEKGRTYQLKIKKGSKTKCSNKKIAKVTKKGKIKALKKGKCTIKVIKGRKVRKYNISVINAQCKKLESPAPTKAPDIQTQNTPSPTKRPPVGYMFFRDMAVEKIEQKDERFSTVCVICDKPVSGLISEEKFQNGVKYIRFDTLSSDILQEEIALGDKVRIGFDLGLIHYNIIDDTLVLDSEGLIEIHKDK